MPVVAAGQEPKTVKDSRYGTMRLLPFSAAQWLVRLDADASSQDTSGVSNDSSINLDRLL
jgi:hypothetical protein